MKQDPTFFCWATRRNDIRSKILRISGSLHGVRIRLSQCNSLLDKPRSLLRTLNSSNGCELIVISDGFDVLYCRGTQNIFSQFEKFGTEIVFGGELAPVHHTRTTERVFANSKSVGPYRYLNSGMLIGRSVAIETMLRQILEKDFVMDAKTCFERESAFEFRGHFNDQTLFGLFAAMRPEMVSIDTNAEIFWNLSRECQGIREQIAFDSDGVLNKKTGTRPMLVHVPYLARYYATYLWIAAKVGVHLSSMNVCVDLWESSVSEGMVSIDDVIRDRVEKLWRYRLRLYRRTLRNRWIAVRMYLGYWRRRLIQWHSGTFRND